MIFEHNLNKRSSIDHHMKDSIFQKLCWNRISLKDQSYLAHITSTALPTLCNISFSFEDQLKLCAISFTSFRYGNL